MGTLLQKLGLIHAFKYYAGSKEPSDPFVDLAPKGQIRDTNMSLSNLHGKYEQVEKAYLRKEHASKQCQRLRNNQTPNLDEVEEVHTDNQGRATFKDVGTGTEDRFGEKFGTEVSNVKKLTQSLAPTLESSVSNNDKGKGQAFPLRYLSDL